MSDYKTLLVHAEDIGADARLQLAAALSGRFDATLIGLAAGEAVPPMVTDPMGADGELIAEAIRIGREEIAAEMAAAELRFRALTGKLPERRTTWRTAFDNPAAALAREARDADLLIIGRDLERLRRGVFRAADPGDVLMLAGRPVLVVPPGLAEVTARHVVLAWKDTREARRAAADAMPFLRQADQVLVLEVCAARCGEDELKYASERVTGVAAWLERHGVARVTAEAMALREDTTTDQILLAAEQQHADLIVAGGYGHARAREWIFGGVTRGLLHHCPKCCLLSH